MEICIWLKFDSCFHWTNCGQWSEGKLHKTWRQTVEGIFDKKLLVLSFADITSWRGKPLDQLISAASGKTVSFVALKKTDTSKSVRISAWYKLQDPYIFRLLRNNINSFPTTVVILFQFELLIIDSKRFVFVFFQSKTNSLQALKKLIFSCDIAINGSISKLCHLRTAYKLYPDID